MPGASFRASCWLLGISVHLLFLCVKKSEPETGDLSVFSEEIGSYFIASATNCPQKNSQEQNTSSNENVYHIDLYTYITVIFS